MVAAIQFSTDYGMHESGEFAPCLCWVLAMLPSPGFPYMAPESASRRRHPLMATTSMASASERLCRSMWSWCRVFVLAREGRRHSKQLVAPCFFVPLRSIAAGIGPIPG